MNQSFLKFSGNFFFFIRVVHFFHIGAKIQSRKLLIRKIEQIQVEISHAENSQDSGPLMGSCAI